jgi:hypothetical protein
MIKIIKFLNKNSLFFTKIQNKYCPISFWNTLSKDTKNIFQFSALILSFDCDTDQDIDVAWDVHSRLMDMGVLPVYAVPGDLLKRGEKVYRKIFETGAEFINHGGREHTYFDKITHRHASCFFYDQQTKEILKEDILKGHNTLQDVLGITPKGFRTPHFGTFQKREHLSFLYQTLKEMGYLFSSSTVPLKAYQRGPIYQDSGIFEIPVTGVFSEPMNILDTWGFFEAPDRQKSAENYIRECENFKNFSYENPIVLNIYGDPSHIYNEPTFFKSMQNLSQSIKNYNFSQLIESLK